MRLTVRGKRTRNDFPVCHPAEGGERGGPFGKVVKRKENTMGLQQSSVEMPFGKKGGGRKEENSVKTRTEEGKKKEVHFTS